MKQKTTAHRFRLPYTSGQVCDMLLQACRVEVQHRHRDFYASPLYLACIRDIAAWLTSSDSTFGLFICGGAGNGKSTILHALRNLIRFLRADEPYSRTQNDFVIISARRLVSLAKAHNNPTRETQELADSYRKALDTPVLAIDDLGTEPRESMHYGDFVMAATDILTHRYDMQLCTLVTSNLAAAEIATYYDNRIADRFAEMMHIVNFGNQQSYRKNPLINPNS